MTKRANARGYFSQLAEPLPPGGPVLTARPGALPSAGSERSLVPAIEDRFEVAESPWTPLPHEAWRARRKTPFASTEPQPLEASASHADRAPAPLPRGEATVVARARARRQPEARQDEAPASRATTSASPLTPKQAAEERDSEGGGSFNPRIKPAESTWSPPRRTPGARTTPISLEAPSLSAASKAVAAGGFRAEVKRAAPAPLDVADEVGAERKSAPEASAARRAQPALLPVAAAEEGRASVGSRVHIGTVEIRAVLPQPPVERPIASPPTQTRESRMAPARAQSGAAEPLARGLSWSYGLVQG